MLLISRANSETMARMTKTRTRPAPGQLVLVRHGQSDWNQKNLFTGWTDVDLTAQGREPRRARPGARWPKPASRSTSRSRRCSRARSARCGSMLDEMKLMWIPVENSWRLNERHYGSLQGLDKAQTTAKHGEAQVKIWRRSYDIPPPPLERATSAIRCHDPRYAALTPTVLPGTESLKTTLARVQPYWEDRIAPEILRGRNVLVAAHGNSLRALVKMLEGVSDDEITELNIPTGVPRLYELDAQLDAEARRVSRRRGRDRRRGAGRRQSGEREEVDACSTISAASRADRRRRVLRRAERGRDRPRVPRPRRERLVQRRAARRRQRHPHRRSQQRAGHRGASTSTPTRPCTVGNDVTIGHWRHRARLHGRRLHADRHRRDDPEPRRDRQVLPRRRGRADHGAQGVRRTAR